MFKFDSVRRSSNKTKMPNECFSLECGFCSHCCGSMDYVLPPAVYTMETGKLPPPEPLRVDTWDLYKDMLSQSCEYRWSKSGIYSRWSIITRLLKIRAHYYELYKEGGVISQIGDSNIEFLKSCTEEAVIYGEDRRLKLEAFSINLAVQYGDVDINRLGGKVVCAGGGLFDLDTLKKTMNLDNEEYEKYFEKFGLYTTELNKKLEEYGVELGLNCRGKVPALFLYGGEEYTFTGDTRAMCDDPECCLMTHCMVNWDASKNGKDQSTPYGMRCYTGSRPPEHDSHYYGRLVGLIPKYTKNKTHELCLLCIIKDS